MKNNPISILISSLLILALQVIIIDNINLFGYLNPLVYLYIILFLPTKIKSLPVLFIGFTVGYIVDLFQGTGGIHASGALLLAFIRPYILRAVSTQGGLEYEQLNIKTLGFGKVVVYSAIGLFTTSLWINAWEAFSFSMLFSVIFDSIINTLVTLVLLMIMQMAVYSRKVY